MLQLFVKIPGEEEVYYDLEEGENTVGRSSENDIQIEDASISGQHAQIIVSNNKATIRDCDSTNGTVVNGQKVQEARLTPQDSIFLGQIAATLRVSELSARDHPLPDIEQSSDIQPATRSACPDNFINPLPSLKKESVELGAASQTILAFGAIGFLAFAISMLRVLTMQLP